MCVDFRGALHWGGGHRWGVLGFRKGQSASISCTDLWRSLPLVVSSSSTPPHHLLPTHTQTLPQPHLSPRSSLFFHLSSSVNCWPKALIHSEEQSPNINNRCQKPKVFTVYGCNVAPCWSAADHSEGAEILIKVGQPTCYGWVAVVWD